MSLSLISGKSAFLHDGYIVAIENCCVPTAVKRTLIPTRVASLLLGASLNTLFATRLMSLLLGASFNTKLLLLLLLLAAVTYNQVQPLRINYLAS